MCQLTSGVQNVTRLHIALYSAAHRKMFSGVHALNQNVYLIRFMNQTASDLTV